MHFDESTSGALKPFWVMAFFGHALTIGQGWF
jgi:hypothetical protein